MSAFLLFTFIFLLFKLCLCRETRPPQVVHRTQLFAALPGASLCVEKHYDFTQSGTNIFRVTWKEILTAPQNLLLVRYEGLRPLKNVKLCQICDSVGKLGYISRSILCGNMIATLPPLKILR